MSNINLDKHTRGRITSEQLNNSAEVIIETPQGNIVYKLNPLMDLNKTYRFKNKGYGYPNVHCGDFYIKFELANYSSFKTYVEDNKKTSPTPNTSNTRSSVKKEQTSYQSNKTTTYKKQTTQNIRNTNTANSYKEQAINVKIPFNLNYTPDLIFAANRSFSNKFPSDAGQGVLNLIFPERAFTKFANLAHCAMIVDNYFIQFSESGNMYILDIIKNTRIDVKIVSDNIPTDLVNWLKSAGVMAVKMMNAVENNKNAQIWLDLYLTLLCYHTTNEVSESAYNYAMQQFRMGFNLSPNDNTMRIINKTWYYGNEQKNWGAIAYNVFRDYFIDFMGYGK